MAGACRRVELYNLRISDVRLEGNVYVITLFETKTHISRTFTIEGEYTPLKKNYISARPNKCLYDKFFLRYNKGRCYNQVIGINKIGAMPKDIAEWLKLPDVNNYTGHSFRRTSTTILADAGASRVQIKRHGGWKTENVVDGYIEDSINSKRKISNLIVNSIMKKKNKKSNAQGNCRTESCAMDFSENDDDSDDSDVVLVCDDESKVENVNNDATDQVFTRSKSKSSKTITLNISLT